MCIILGNGSHHVAHSVIVDFFVRVLTWLKSQNFSYGIHYLEVVLMRLITQNKFPTNNIFGATLVLHAPENQDWHIGVRLTNLTNEGSSHWVIWSTDNDKIYLLISIYDGPIPPGVDRSKSGARRITDDGCECLAAINCHDVQMLFWSKVHSCFINHFLPPST